MSLIPTNPSIATTVRSFWDRKEGKYGKGVLWTGAIAVAAASVFFWSKILLFLIGVVGNTIQLALLTGVLAFIVFLATNKRIHLLVESVFQMSMRWLTYFVISADPIAKLRGNIVKLQKKAVVFDDAITSLAGSKKRLESEIVKNKATIQQNKSLSDEVGRRLAAATQATSTMEGRLAYQRLQLAQEQYKTAASTAFQSIQQEQPILDSTNKLYESLGRLRELSSFKIQTLIMQADAQEQRRKTILASQKALGSANSILKGDPEELDLVNQTIEFLDDEAANTLGAMDDFNKWSDKYLTDMDIQNSAAASQAEALFASMEKKLLPTSTGSNIPIIPSTSIPNSLVPNSTDYSDLLK